MWRVVATVAALVGISACGGSANNGSHSSASCVNVDKTTWDVLGNYALDSGSSVCSGTIANTVSVAQTGCAGTLTFDGSTDLSGTIDGSSVSWSGSFPHNSGNVTLSNAKLTLSSDLKTATGTFDWSYSGAVTCAGHGCFTACNATASSCTPGSCTP